MFYQIKLQQSFTAVFSEIDLLLRDFAQFIARGTSQLAEEAVERMRANHARDAHEIQRYINRTWNLTNSTTSTTDHDQLEDRIRTTFRADTDYAEAVEFGTPRSRPYPFFWMEVRRFEEEALERATENFYYLLARFEAAQRALR